MRCSPVRRTPVVLFGCAAVAISVACSDSNTSLSAPNPNAIERQVAQAPLANATVTDIPALLGFDANSMNDSGEIAGNAPKGPFRWTAKGGVQYLSPSTGLVGAVSNNGAVGGQVPAGDSGYEHAAVWIPPMYTLRVIQQPTDSAGEGCELSAINVYGQMVGNCQVKEGFTTPEEFEWHGPAIAPPGVPEDDQVTAISDDGWIGGGNEPDLFGTTQAFVVSPSGQTIFLRNHLGQAPSDPTWVQGITHHGFAAGVDFEGGCGQAVAWLFNPGQSWPEFRMGTCGQANSITPDWYVVGYGTTAANTNWAFVWFPGVGLQRLPGLTSADQQSVAVAVNQSHHVLGWIQVNGVRHNVIWAVGPRPAATTTTAAVTPPTN